MNTCSKQRFLGGALALTVSTAMVKVIGLVYKIPLMRILGAEGMGYFNSAYELYTLFFVIATAGIPVAISIMISENIAVGRLKNAERIFKISLWTLIFVGLLGSLVLCMGAEKFAFAINSPSAVFAIMAVSPTLFFISVSGAVRGYFQGCRNMLPTAVSQVVESLGKLALGIFFALCAANAGMPVEKVAAFAILGLSVGTMISTVYLCATLSYSGLSLENMSFDNVAEKRKNILKRLFVLAIPVTISSVLVSLTRIVDMFALLNRLGDGVDKIVVYGSYSTMALPIYNLPSSLVAGISLALVPSITNAIESGQKEREKQLVASAVKLSAMVALPCALGIGVYAPQILALLFGRDTEAIDVSGRLLSALGASVFASCLVQVTNSVLQANKKIICPIISMLLGLAVKTVFAYWLVSVPQIGAMGAPISTLLCNVVAVAINLWFIGKYTSSHICLTSILVKPLGVATASVAVSLAVYCCCVSLLYEERGSFLLAAFACVAFYGAMTAFGGVLDDDEYGMLPFGNKIKSVKKSIKSKDKNYEQRRKNCCASGKEKLPF